MDAKKRSIRVERSLGCEKKYKLENFSSSDVERYKLGEKSADWEFDLILFYEFNLN